MVQQDQTFDTKVRGQIKKRNFFKQLSPILESN